LPEEETGQGWDTRRVKKDHPGRRSTRLKGFDYASAGAYFVTICAFRREILFDDPEVAEVVSHAWRDLPLHFQNVVADAFVVMPNHVHGIIRIVQAPSSVGARHASPLRPRTSGLAPSSLGAIVGSFKAAVSRRLREVGLHDASPIWQRNY